jgi:hypothetical protein
MLKWEWRAIKWSVIVLGGIIVVIVLLLYLVMYFLGPPGT